MHENNIGHGGYHEIELGNGNYAVKRPEVTEEMVSNAADKVAVTMIGNPAMAEQITKLWSWGMDGYELAKLLEEVGFEMNALTVSLLDSVSYEVEKCHEEACWAWVRENNILPSLPPGTVTTKGTIAGIALDMPAYYLVKEPGCQQSERFLLLPYEDAVAA